MSRHYDESELRRIFPEFSDFQLLAQNFRGAVFNVFSLHRGHHVALKLTADQGDPEIRMHFEREFNILISNVYNERLVRVYSERGYRPIRMHSGNIVTHYFFTMKLYAGDVGRSLGEQSLDLCSRILVVIQMLEGLSYLHAKGIAHGDVKPSNLFLNQMIPAETCGQPHPIDLKLGDFSIARLADAVPLQIAGTPYYLAPECWDPDLTQLDGRLSDQYAAGVTAFQVLSQGYLPLDFHVLPRDDLRALGRIHQHGIRLPLRIPERTAEGVPQNFPRLEHVLYRMIAANPADRYPNIMRCRIEMQVALAGYGLWPCPHQQDADKQSGVAFEGSVKSGTTASDPPKA